MVRVRRPWLAAGVEGLFHSEEGEALCVRPYRGGRDLVAAGEAEWSQDHAALLDLVGCPGHRLAGTVQLLTRLRTSVENTLHIYGDSEFEDQFLPGSAQ